jgi:hypothetical protein
VSEREREREREREILGVWSLKLQASKETYHTVKRDLLGCI